MPELEKYKNENGKLVARIEKAMYGLIQSAKLWYKHLSKWLERIGFKKNTIDQCVMN